MFSACRWRRENIAVENPAFDVTPARYVTAIISERGVARAPVSGIAKRPRLQKWGGPARTC